MKRIKLSSVLCWLGLAILIVGAIGVQLDAQRARQRQSTALQQVKPKHSSKALQKPRQHGKKQGVQRGNMIYYGTWVRGTTQQIDTDLGNAEGIHDSVDNTVISSGGWLLGYGLYPTPATTLATANSPNGWGVSISALPPDNCDLFVNPSSAYATVVFPSDVLQSPEGGYFLYIYVPRPFYCENCTSGPFHAICYGDVHEYFFTIDHTTPQPTVACFTSESECLTVTLDGTCSTTPSPATITDYDWDLGDGNTANGAVVNHTYAAADTYSVQLTVTDSDANTDDVSHDVTVALDPPVACWSGKTACLSYVLDAGCSAAFCGATISSYAWSGDVTGSGATLEGDFGSAGTKTVTLTVTDSFGNVSDPVTGTLLIKALNEDGSCDWGGGGGTPNGGGGGGGGTGYCAPLNVPNSSAVFAAFNAYNPTLLRFPVQFCGGAQGFEQHSGAPEYRTRVDEFPGSEVRLSYDVNGRRVVEISTMTFDEAAKDEWEAFLGLTDNGAKSFLYFDTARHILDAEVIAVSDGIETQFQLTYTRAFLEQSKTIEVYYPDHGYPPTYGPQGPMMAAPLSHATQFLTLLLDGVESAVGWVVSLGSETALGGLLEIAGPVAPGIVLTVDGHFFIRMIIESPQCPMLRAVGMGLYELSTPLRLIETEEFGGL